MGLYEWHATVHQPWIAKTTVALLRWLYRSQKESRVRLASVPGKEAADSLVKEGTTNEQVDRSTSYPEVKTILKAKQHSKWRHKYPRYNKADPYYLLTRRDQVIVFRLRTGHNRLSYHLYIFQTPHRLYRAVPLRDLQSDNRTSTAVLPHLGAT